MKFTLARLNNGVQVVAAPMPSMYSVAISVGIGVGSRHEQPADAGSAHLIEHLLFKGTTGRPSAEAISETIERVGGMINAGTDKELTTLWARASGAQAEVAGDLLADMILNSRLDASDVEKERRVVLEELSMSLDAPQDWVHSLIDQQCWPESALGRDVLGTRESIAGLTRDRVLAFKDRAYQPESLVVSIAGAIETDVALDMAERLFGHWRPDSHALPSPDAAAYSAGSPSVVYEPRDTEQVNLCLATAGVSHRSADRFGFDLLTAILGGGMSSRLFVEVRERRALAYDIHTYSNKLADTGSLVTYVAVDPENCRDVVAEVLRQLTRLRDEPVPEAELEKVKDYSKGRLLLGLEDTQSVAGWCGEQQQLHGEILVPEEVCEAIDRVSRSDIQRLAGACFRDEYLRLAALGPAGGARGLDSALQLG
ncbi:MAG TPA: pitrilysin family protein [Chloroflexota bacterium]|jgi:predicted Zn-dependent peptidase